MEDWIHRLERRLQQPLPGEPAQIEMAHAFRRKLWPAPPEARDAAVLILCYPRQNDWWTVFIERTSSNDRDRHSGQISFPGGKREPGESIEACAVREAHEEIAVEPDSVRVIGALTPLYIPVSGFLVHPVVGYTEQPSAFVGQQTEVASILEVPFRHFTLPDNRKHTDMLLGNGMKVKDVPYFDASGRVIWGATAMILSELLYVLERPAAL